MIIWLVLKYVNVSYEDTLISIKAFSEEQAARDFVEKQSSIIRDKYSFDIEEVKVDQ